MRADLVLGEAAEREPHRRELLDRHREQEVRLVLAGVEATPQLVIAAVVDDLRVVAGDEYVGADRTRPLQERRELDVLVALHTRVRRLAREGRLDEVVHDRGAELGGEIHDVVRDAEVCGDRARVLDIARAAAPATRRCRRAARVVQAHGHRDDAMPLLHQQRRRGRAVDAARERGDDEWRIGGGHRCT